MRADERSCTPEVAKLPSGRAGAFPPEYLARSSSVAVISFSVLCPPLLLGTPEAASLVRRYWARERLAQQPPEAPLFWTLGRHGRCRRTRVTGHAVNYWLEQLRRRGGLEGRLTSRSLRQPPASR